MRYKSNRLLLCNEIYDMLQAAKASAGPTHSRNNGFTIQNESSTAKVIIESPSSSSVKTNDNGDIEELLDGPLVVRIVDEASAGAVESRQYETIVRLKEALGKIGRMRCYPDHKINTTTLVFAAQIAREALNPIACPLPASPRDNDGEM
jgi:hypothetical protein